MDGDIVVVAREGVSYRASSLGSCIRALAAARQELEPYRGPLPSVISATFAKGHEMEQVGRRWFLDRGWGVKDEQKEVVVQLTSRLRIVGHIDFIVVDKDEDQTIMDVKRQNDEEWAKDSIRDSLFWHKYAWQFSSYYWAVGGIPFGVCRINDAGDVKLELLTVPYSRADLLRRVLEVEQMAAKELRGLKCDRDDFPCPYWRILHDQEDWTEIEDTEIADLALHYRRLGAEIDPLRARQKEIREQIVKKVGEMERVRELTSGIEVKVTTYPVKERTLPAGVQTRVTVRLPDDTRPDQ